MSEQFLSSGKLGESSRPFPSTYVKGFHDEKAVSNMEYRPLGNTGLQVSVLGFGTSPLGSVLRKTDDSESVQVVHHALKSGINLIDTAPWYGHGKSEKVLGQALKGIPRESYILATKVGPYLPELEKMFDFSAERVTRMIDESLERLGLSYIDIIQVHDMEFADSLDIIINETLPALQKVKDQGKVKFIGITGYPLQNFRTVIEKSQVPIDTVLTYCRCTMHDTQLLDYLPFFKEHGVGVINAAPISMGLLSHRGPPASHPASKETKEKCQQAAEYCKAQGVDMSKLALYFTLSVQSIPTTLVGTTSLENLKKNVASVNQKLTTHEEQVLNHVMNNIFKPCGNMAWEGIEVAQYREELKSIKSA